MAASRAATRQAISGRRNLVNMVALQIGGLGGVERALGAPDQLAEFAGGTFASAGAGHTIGMLADEAVGVGNRHAQAYTTDYRKIRQIVAQVSDFVIA